MVTWYAKAGIQGVLGQLPNPDRANRVFQRYVARGLDLDCEFFAEKMAVAERHLSHWRQETGSEGLPRTVLELGTGWHPVVPVALALAGCHSVSTVDVHPLLGDQQVVETARAFMDLAESSSSSFPLVDDATSRLQNALRLSPQVSAKERLGLLGVESIIGDCADLDLATGSIDLFVSNNTLEHVPPSEIAAIAREFHRLSTPEAVGSHLVDLRDHYSHFDSSITEYHFLRFSERRWRLFNNRLQYQNRLRDSQYVATFTDASWRVSEADVERNLDSLSMEPIHAEFANFTLDDLAVHTAWYRLRPEALDSV